jgi:hypothetical protein
MCERIDLARGGPWPAELELGTPIEETPAFLARVAPDLLTKSLLSKSDEDILAGYTGL